MSSQSIRVKDLKVCGMAPSTARTDCIVWIDIGMGDAEEHRLCTQRFERFEKYVREKGAAQIGREVPTGAEATAAMSEEELEMLSDMFSADPSGEENPVRMRPASLLAGRLVIELDSAGCPRAAENFRCMCTGEKGTSRSSGKSLHLKSSPFHRVESGFVMQGGDTIKGDGSCAESIYGMKFGKDEAAGLRSKHEPMGTLAMANAGKPNSSSGQWYLTIAADGDKSDSLKKLKKLDGKHVVFGRVVEGLDVLRRVANEASTPSGTPRVDVWVMDCGQMA